MTFAIDDKATKVARARHVRGVDRLNAIFGVTVDRDADGHVLPPPPKVMAVLMAGAARLEGRGITGGAAAAHGPRALRRRTKRRRYAANTRRLERNGWRSFNAEAKRRALSLSSTTNKES